MITFPWILDLAAIFTHPLVLGIAAAGSLWVLFFHPRLRMVPFGFLAFVLALIIEYYALPFSYLDELLFIAPFVEELLKYLMNRAKDLRGGIGTGMGFAIIENASYFFTFLGSPYLVVEIIVRSFSDVIMHSFNAGLSSFTQRGKGKLKYGLIYAIAIHGAFNYGTLLLKFSVIAEIIFLSLVFTIMALLLNK